MSGAYLAILGLGLLLWSLGMLFGVERLAGFGSGVILGDALLCLAIDLLDKRRIW